MQRLFNRIKSILIGFCFVLGLLFIGVSPAQAQATSYQIEMKLRQPTFRTSNWHIEYLPRGN